MGWSVLCVRVCACWCVVVVVVWCGVVWCGVVWCGVVWYGEERGLVSRESVVSCGVGVVRCDVVRCAMVNKTQV